MKVAVVIPGEPVAKGRPRMNTRTGKAFTPRETKAAEERIGWECKQQLAGLDLPLADGLIKLEMSFYSTNDPSNPIGRKDLDNMVKIVGDSLNSVIWDDDWRVVEIHAYLYRHCTPEQARTVLWIEQFDTTEQEDAA